MSDYRQLFREYIRASEALLKAEELSGEERKLIEEALKRISRDLLDGRIPLDGHDVDENKDSNRTG